MSIVTITDGLFGSTEILGHRVSSILGYRYLGQEQLAKHLQLFWQVKGRPLDILEVEPPWWKRLMERPKLYEVGLRSAICEIAEGANFVYNGNVGQELLPGLRQILRILVIFPNEYRIERVSQWKGISLENARCWFAKMDEVADLRIKAWFGLEWLVHSRYDDVLNISHLSLETAADLIIKTARQVEFQATGESESKFQDFILEGKLRGALLASPNTCNIDVKLQVVNGFVHLSGTLPPI